MDSCRQLITVSQSNGDEDTAGMVTILTGHQVEQLCSQSTAMKVCYLLTLTTAHQNRVMIFLFIFLLYFFMHINRNKWSAQCIDQLMLL